MKKSNWRKEVINEFRTNHPVADMVIGAGVAGQKVGKYLDKKITPKLNPLPNYKPIPQFQDIKKYKKGEDGVTKLYTDKELEKKKQERIKKAGELTVAPEKDTKIKGFKPTPYNPKGFEPSDAIKKERERLIKQRENEKKQK